MPKAIAISKVDGKPGQVYYPLTHISQPSPDPGPHDVVVRLTAASLNHRDLFIRQHLYPGTTFEVPLLADGCGVVVSTGSDPAAKRWAGKRVVLNPGLGWKDSPEGPEGPGYAIMGGTKFNPLGTLANFATIDADEVEEAPEHLTDVEAAAVPLVGLTAWRAFYTKSGNAVAGRNVLITGIGGGVALAALSFAVARGCNVYVTSGSDEKLRKAKELGAKGGVSYKEKGWEKNLKGMLPSERGYFDTIIDGAGGDSIEKSVKLLKAGGTLVIYGMTVSPKMPFTMNAVLQNIDIKGSTMGSRKEFKDMIAFMKEKKVKPVISQTAKGLDDLGAIDELFDVMKKGSQFGKLVVEIPEDASSSKL